ncbi:MAG TPA: hypothetical protein VJS15_10550 [Allosphingosinicella sp.]|nr:hypothetical protein [Allosphingosinicella sp.]
MRITNVRYRRRGEAGFGRGDLTRVVSALLATCLFAVAGCALLPDRADAQEADVRAPVLVRALSLGARQVTPTEAVEDLIVLYEVRLEVSQVLAGAPEGSMESDTVTVRLAASNAGHFRRGAELVVLLDPRRMALSRALYWRRFTQFACVATSEVRNSALDLSDRRPIVVGDDTCIFYGP